MKKILLLTLLLSFSNCFANECRDKVELAVKKVDSLSRGISISELSTHSKLISHTKSQLNFYIVSSDKDNYAASYEASVLENDCLIISIQLTHLD